VGSRVNLDDSEVAELREAFVNMLTVDSDSKDRRRTGYNQAIFSPPYRPGEMTGGYSDGGYAIWNKTDLSMVLDKFDKAVKMVLTGK
jgi:hypothetical protein